MKNLYNDVYDDHYTALVAEQVTPFGKKSDIDFIEQDDTSYYAMADDMKESEK